MTAVYQPETMLKVTLFYELNKVNSYLETYDSILTP